MRKKSTRLLSAALAACMMLSVLPVGAFALEEGAKSQNGTETPTQANVPIDVEHFPDENFRNYIFESGIDKNQDKKLDANEIAAVSVIDCQNREIESLKGIEFFTALRTLSCGKNQLSELDVSQCVNLANLYCLSNNLTTLDVSGKTSLRELDCSDNNLQTLNINGCVNLTRLACDKNKLSELDISDCRQLSNLTCSGNALKELDITNAPLKTLSCSYNSLRVLDVTNKSALTGLDCRDNQLESLSIAGCTSLQALACQNNDLQELEITDCTQLRTLYCVSNSLKALDVSGKKELREVDCASNKQLQKLDVTGCENLTRLVCDGDSISQLEVSECEKLTTLSCSQNKLSQLNVNGCNSLKDLRCAGNGLTELTVLNKMALLRLDCYGNQLESLDMTGCTALQTLACQNNKLKELNISDCSQLQTLYCGANQLQALDVKNCAKLKTLHSELNQLQSLDIDNCAQLADFACGNNRYRIAVGWRRQFNLNDLPGKPNVSKIVNESLTGGAIDNTTLTVDEDANQVTYTYNCGKGKTEVFTLLVHVHGGTWKPDLDNEEQHMRTCPDDGEVEYAPHRFDSATGRCKDCGYEHKHFYSNAYDRDCNGCGYERPMYTVTTENATAKLEGETEALNAPVAAGTKVTLTAGDDPEGKEFAGWKLYKVENGTETEITDEAEIAVLLTNGTETITTLTMPAYNVKAEPDYNNIQYHVSAVNCTVDKTEAVMGDTVTAEPTEQGPGKRFKGWKVTKKVGGKDVDITDELHDASETGRIFAELTMPTADVTIEAVFAANEPELPVPGKDDPGVNVDHIVSVANGEVTAIDDVTVPGVGEKASPDIATAKEGQKVTVTADERLDGQLFVGWVAEGIDLKDAVQDGLKLTFTMPGHDVALAANYEEAGFEPDKPVVTDDPADDIKGALSAVVVGAAAGAIIYETGTGIYRVLNMPGIPMPSNRIELAELLWERADKPEPVSTALYDDIDEDDTDAQKAAHWAVEQDLMQDDADNNKFNPHFPVSKLRTCLTWNAAKEKGLFDKTAE